MVISIQYLPSEIFGDIITNFEDPEDVIDCTLVCRDWHETIKTNSVSLRLILNLSPGVSIDDLPKPYYDFLRNLLISFQQPSKFKIQSKDIDDLNAIADEFNTMGQACGYHVQSDYQIRISDKLNQLPPSIKNSLYHRLHKACEGTIVYDFPGWGRQIFHSGEHRRSLPNCSARREVVLAQVEEEKLKTLANTLIHDGSERGKERAIKQLSQFSPEIKDGVYSKLAQLLTIKELFHHASAKAAFYDGDIPKNIKGTAIHLYLFDMLDNNS